jgi:phage terminase large subunit
MTKAQILVPPKLVPVFAAKDVRFRCAFGGRGSGKTRTFALMSAVWGYKFGQSGKSGRILCAREFVNSLDDSSMEEVKQAIKQVPWLNDYYDCGEKYIRSKDGRISYVFAGLNRSLESLKSKSKLILAWVDEAEKVSEKAWGKLIPTVREDDSEIWVTWNPESEKSATHQRFRVDPPEDLCIAEIQWFDNPWFPEVLEKNRLQDQVKRPSTYHHIWEGAFLTNSEVRVFNNWRVEEFEANADDVLRFGADWGFASDPTVLIRCFIRGRTLYIDYEAYMVGCEILNIPDLFMTVPESERYPIVADSARPETISHVKKHGFPRIMAAVKGPKSLEDGVEWLKSFDIVVHPRCTHTIDELSLYSYKVDKMTEQVLPTLEDKQNHVIDALRYACEGVRRANKRTMNRPNVAQAEYAIFE